MGHGFGYDAKEDRFVDMLKEGICDPVMVSRMALETSASLSEILLTSGAGMVEKKETQFDMPELPDFEN